MTKDTLYVGLDTDKKHIDVAVAEPLPGGEVRYWGQIANTAAAVSGLVKRLQQAGRRLVVCYEAATGFTASSMPSRKSSAWWWHHR